jgi:hypothetical protein
MLQPFTRMPNLYNRVTLVANSSRGQGSIYKLVKVGCPAPPRIPLMPGDPDEALETAPFFAGTPVQRACHLGQLTEKEC